MTRGWSTLACAAILGGAIGFAAGYLFPASRLSSSSSDPSGNWATFAPNAEFPHVSGETDTATEADSVAEQPVYFPDHAHSDQTAIAATNTALLVDAAAVGAETSEPGALPAGHGASPITGEEPADDDLQGLLDAELADVPGEDRQVWLDVLQGLPPEDALGILRMWKRFGTQTGGIPASPSASARPFVTPPAAVPLTEVRHPAPDPVIAQFHAARAVLIDNLTRCWTPAYQRIEPVLNLPSDELAEAAPPAPEAVSLMNETAARENQIATRIDLTPGELRFSARPLDVAIGGMGFFVFERSGRTLFARCGRFTMDAERRIVLADQAGPCVLQPEITIPDDATQIAIDQYGTVSVSRRASDEKEALGQIELALFMDPAALTVLDGLLYAANDDSGMATIDRPSRANRGLLSQFHIEASNTTYDAEIKRVRQIDELIKLRISRGPAK
ncbi:MAG: flagellar hook basal-body protein [Planctomycetota bacterium]|nr:MAG: flagellar hook basal-body protein [Planctomycetota bacterium]REK23597.1 MAG: flagellar hook basal-body protein [Planctomycetota bacterium]REK31178.1 MAG: flagellar hook basal-body protein [Planctomycetota bacterium]